MQTMCYIVNEKIGKKTNFNKYNFYKVTFELFLSIYMFNSFILLHVPRIFFIYASNESPSDLN